MSIRSPSIVATHLCLLISLIQRHLLSPFPVTSLSFFGIFKWQKRSTEQRNISSTLGDLQNTPDRYSCTSDYSFSSSLAGTTRHHHGLEEGELKNPHWSYSTERYKQITILHIRAQSSVRKSFSYTTVDVDFMPIYHVVETIKDMVIMLWGCAGNICVHCLSRSITITLLQHNISWRVWIELDWLWSKWLFNILHYYKCRPIKGDLWLILAK